MIFTLGATARRIHSALIIVSERNERDSCNDIRPKEAIWFPFTTVENKHGSGNKCCVASAMLKHGQLSLSICLSFGGSAAWVSSWSLQAPQTGQVPLCKQPPHHTSTS